MTGLIEAGFVPVEARQTHARRSSLAHAQHVLRLRRRFETVQLKGSVPEVVFLNSHDGSSAYQLRMGLFRVVCTNDLIVSRGAFPACCVPHRGNVVDEVVTVPSSSRKLRAPGRSGGAHGGAPPRTSSYGSRSVRWRCATRTPRKHACSRRSCRPADASKTRAMISSPS
jgi:Domain of unknown function (DUF932)